MILSIIIILIIMIIIVTEKKGIRRGLNPDFCDAGAVLSQLTRRNWELVTMWVHDKLVHSGYTCTQKISYVLRLHNSTDSAMASQS